MHLEKSTHEGPAPGHIKAVLAALTGAEQARYLLFPSGGTFLEEPVRCFQALGPGSGSDCLAELLTTLAERT